MVRARASCLSVVLKWLGWRLYVILPLTALCAAWSAAAVANLIGPNRTLLPACMDGHDIPSSPTTCVQACPASVCIACFVSGCGLERMFVPGTHLFVAPTEPCTATSGGQGLPATWLLLVCCRCFLEDAYAHRAHTCCPVLCCAPRIHFKNSRVWSSRCGALLHRANCQTVMARQPGGLTLAAAVGIAMP